MRTNPEGTITRRQFLIGSATIAGPIALGSMSRAFAEERRGAGAMESAGHGPRPAALSVGYLEGSEHVRLDGLIAASRAPRASAEAAWRAGSGPIPGGKVVPASRLPYGDLGLVGRGVRLTIHGLYRADATLFGPEVERLSVHVHFPVPDGALRRTVRFAAWHYDRRPVVNVSRAVGLTVPVAPDAGLRLTVGRGNADRSLVGRMLDRVTRGTPASAGTTEWIREVAFTAGDEPHLPKLRRGVYFIAAAAQVTHREHDWHRYRFAHDSDGGAAGLLVRQGLLGGEPADFDYLVVSVDRTGAIATV